MTNLSPRNSISQYGITWTFDRPVASGQFITGDWWVVGPVTVTGVTPAPGPAPADAAVTIRINHWGDTTLRNDNRLRNGSMVVLQAGQTHGYDSRSSAFDPACSIGFPYRLDVNRSLISTISHTALPVDNFCKNILWEKEKQLQNVLKAAGVLTCLAEVPPADAFRPPYAGTEKRLWRFKDVNWELLLKLKPPDAKDGTVPDWAEFERYFQRPWLDHLMEWMQQELNPTENGPNYGREYARLVSMASLMLQLDVPRERKEKLLTGLIQYGLDIHGIARVGGCWNWGGGHASGRKWPLLFASLMLGDPSLRDLPGSALFQEDTQTYYGRGWCGQTVLWQMILHHGVRQPYEEKPPEQWEAWDKTSENYRVCCNAMAWIGTALSSRLMRAIGTWQHDAFFDYCDRWMRTDDPYAEQRGGHPRPKQETTTYDPFVDAMWRAYRESAPEQPLAGGNRKWTVGEPGHWERNERVV